MKHDYKSDGLKHRIGFIFKVAVWACVSAAIGVTACSKMDDTYKDFWKDGERVYPASPDSVKVYSGKNRIGLTWLILGDPTVTKANVYWNNKNDSMELSIERSEKSVDTVKVLLADMKEGSYSFTVYTFDDKGNRSIPADAVGRVYGDAYVSSLLIRLIDSATFIDDSLKIAWGNPADGTSIGSELVYMDVAGVRRNIYVAADADSTYVLDYNFSADKTFSYRTMYLPDSLAIDTFYTAYSTVKVKGPRVDISKTVWTATASSFDSRSGASYRPPENTIDNNISTIWVNQISPQTEYPHWLMIDMGSVMEDIEGLSFIVQNRNETPKTIDISISEDDVSWISMGRFTIQNIATTRQYIDFSESRNLRYFKVTAVEPYGNTSNAVIVEVGAFTR